MTSPQSIGFFSADLVRGSLANLHDFPAEAHSSRELLASRNAHDFTFRYNTRKQSIAVSVAVLALKRATVAHTGNCPIVNKDTDWIKLSRISGCLEVQQTEDAFIGTVLKGRCPQSFRLGSNSSSARGLRSLANATEGGEHSIMAVYDYGQ